MKFSDRILNIKPSATIAVSAKAKALKAQGFPVLSMSVGEPDFSSPDCANKAGIEAIKRGESHYTLNNGIKELRDAVSEYYDKRFGLTYKPTQVFVSTGAKAALYESFGALVNPGDEVIIFTPAWVSYKEIVKSFGGKPVCVDTLSTNFLPTREAIEAAITPNTKGILVNSPQNPTGAVYPRDTLLMIAEVVREHDLWVISDDIYERLVYEPHNFLTLLQVAPDLYDQTIIINGASKSYAMTGWRIGYAIGPEDAIKMINKFASHITSNASSIAQWAALGAITEGDDDVKYMHSEFSKRRAKILDLLSDMPYIQVREPEGAFYVLVDIRNCPISDDLVFATELLEKKYVAAVPGTAFDAPGYVRFSYASSMDTVVECMKRLKEFLEEME